MPCRHVCAHKRSGCAGMSVRARGGQRKRQPPQPGFPTTPCSPKWLRNSAMRLMPAAMVSVNSRFSQSAWMAACGVAMALGERAGGAQVSTTTFDDDWNRSVLSIAGAHGWPPPAGCCNTTSVSTQCPRSLRPQHAAWPHAPQTKAAPQSPASKCLALENDPLPFASGGRLPRALQAAVGYAYGTPCLCSPCLPAGPAPRHRLYLRQQLHTNQTEPAPPTATPNPTMCGVLPPS